MEIEWEKIKEFTWNKDKTIKKMNIKCDREKLLTFLSSLFVQKDNLNRR